MVNIKRLIELRDNVLPFIPPKQLKMETWTGYHDELPNGCGTVACVAGWAGVHPPFNADGYHLEPKLEGGFRPSYSGSYARCPVSQVRSFFDLAGEEFEYIFGAFQPNDPVLIAQHITDVIEADA